MDAFWIYVTASSEEEAERIGRITVEERLAACANILGTIRSLYRWEGKMEEGREVAVVLKTQGPLVDRLTARVKELHSYTVPCVVALPIQSGNPDYLAWIARETA